MKWMQIGAWVGVACLCLAMAWPLHAADDEPEPAADKVAAAEEPVHDELRALRDGLVAAINKGDVEGILSYCHPNVALTTPDAVVSKGTAAVRAYYDSKTKGPHRVVDAFNSQPTVDDLSTMFGGTTAVATGTSIDHFKMKGGMEFDLNARWSATLVKEDGKWLIANYHTATNVFDNPMLHAATRGIYWAGGICLLVGALVGALLTWFFRPRVV